MIQQALRAKIGARDWSTELRYKKKKRSGSKELIKKGQVREKVQKGMEGEPYAYERWPAFLC